LKPLSDRIEAIDHLVSEHFDHELIEADKLHTCAILRRPCFVQLILRSAGRIMRQQSTRLETGVACDR
jgi:hypothetical protein